MIRNKRVDAILFDFGNIIYSADHLVFCRYLVKYSPLDTQAIYGRIFKPQSGQPSIESILDRGGNLNYFYRASIEAVGIKPEQVGLKAFDNAWCSIFSPIPGMAEFLDRIKPSIRKVLISNTNLPHWSGVMKDLPLIKAHFPGPENWSLSFEVGHRKKDIRHFADGLAKAACPPGKVLYLDDIEDFVREYKTCFRSNAVCINVAKEGAAALEQKLEGYDIFV